MRKPSNTHTDRGGACLTKQTPPPIGELFHIIPGYGCGGVICGLWWCGMWSVCHSPHHRDHRDHRTTAAPLPPLRPRPRLEPATRMVSVRSRSSLHGPHHMAIRRLIRSSWQPLRVYQGASSGCISDGGGQKCISDGSGGGQWCISDGSGGCQRCTQCGQYAVPMSSCPSARSTLLPLQRCISDVHLRRCTFGGPKTVTSDRTKRRIAI